MARIESLNHRAIEPLKTRDNGPMAQSPDGSIPSADSGQTTDPKILLDPTVHFKVALELLADFCHRFQLDPAREFEEMFRCWNTGQPHGATYDPHYAENGISRMAVYAAIAAENRSSKFENRNSKIETGRTA